MVHLEQLGAVFISIHALRVEGDAATMRPALTPSYFYPRPPGGGRPVPAVPHGDLVVISIHALRVEGDVVHLEQLGAVFISIHALRVEGDSKNGQSFHLFLRKREKNLPL